MADYDLAVIGGGINGAGIARDAAGRGLRVLLVEQSDLASGTSSASTKLIHGGLRYLEHGWFGLVRQALAEREVLLRMAPHLIRPMRFVLPQEPGMRPFWLLRLGLFIYDHLGGRKILPATRTIDLSRDALGAPRVSNRARRYASAARVTAESCVHGGYTCRRRLLRVGVGRPGEVRGRRDLASARALVNATGPWVGIFNQTILHRSASTKLRLDQGSHIVVRRLFEHDRGYILQTVDGRIVFALPFEQNFTLIGTTDQSFSGDPGRVAPAAEEVSYLCSVVNDHFRTTVTPADVIWSFAGVRALYHNGSRKPQDTPRDYVLVPDKTSGRAPLLTVYGGKITTYRRLAEDVLDALAPMLGARPAWTKNTRLPGGEIATDGLEQLIEQTRTSWPFLTESHARRLVRSYGTRAGRLLGSAKSLDDLGPLLGSDLTGAEVRYLMEHEWAQTEDDVLWRRTKLGLLFSRAERHRLGRFMADAIGDAAR